MYDTDMMSYPYESTIAWSLLSIGTRHIGGSIGTANDAYQFLSFAFICPQKMPNDREIYLPHLWDLGDSGSVLLTK